MIVKRGKWQRYGIVGSVLVIGFAAAPLLAHDQESTHASEFEGGQPSKFETLVAGVEFVTHVTWAPDDYAGGYGDRDHEH